MFQIIGLPTCIPDQPRTYPRVSPQICPFLLFKCFPSFSSWIIRPLGYQILYQTNLSQPSTLLIIHIRATVQPSRTISTIPLPLILGVITVPLLMYPYVTITELTAKINAFTYVWTTPNVNAQRILMDFQCRSTVLLTCRYTFYRLEDQSQASMVYVSSVLTSSTRNGHAPWL